jgi:hypothetical protein
MDGGTSATVIWTVGSPYAVSETSTETVVPEFSSLLVFLLIIPQTLAITVSKRKRPSLRYESGEEQSN